MTAVLEFLGSLLDAAGLLGLALAAGGCVHVLLILRPPCEPAAAARVAVGRALLAAALGAAVLGLARGAALVLKPFALADASGEGPYAAFLTTHTFRAGLTGVALAVALALLMGWWRWRPASPGRRAGALAGLGVLLVQQAWLSHGVSRLEGGGPLMSVTVLHMAGALVWAGGVAHLMMLWWQARRDPASAPLWPLALARFSPLGIAAMLLVLLPGTFLAVSYVGSPAGLVGSSYGNMLLAKLVLLALVLALALGNLRDARRWRLAGSPGALWTRVPAHVEVELVLAAALLVTAASLASYPPPVDVPEQTATPAELWSVFAPKVPVLTGPERVLVESVRATDLRTGAVGYEVDLDWDNFNHNLSGVIVLAMALLALLDWSGRAAWARHWPLVLIAFSVLIALFANPGHWPLGRRGFFESVRDVEWLQHMAAAAVVFGLGVFEWRARRESFAHPRLRFVFPLLCIVGGLILLTHSHGEFETRNNFLIQSTHVVMGLFGVVMGCARWLELRLAPPRGRVAGLASILAMAVVGVTLLFYVDPGMVRA